MLDIPAANVVRKGRLQPGKLFLVDLDAGPHRPRRRGEAAGRDAAGRTPTGSSASTCGSPTCPSAARSSRSAEPLRSLQLAFGYTQEDMKVMLAPLAVNAEEAIGSMGNDTPLAALSNRRPLLYSYFKQLFAQVTNPPIDSTREAVVMSVQSLVGSERNLLDETPEHARQLVIDNPILTDASSSACARSTPTSSRRTRSTCTWPAADGPAGLEAALERLCADADAALARGANILILSDRAVGAGARADPVAARRRRRCTIISCARGRGSRPASSSSRASRAACRASPC